MRIFVAGASGAIGRRLLPLLVGHRVFGMTRSRPELIRGLGAEPVVADVYDRDAVRRAVLRAQPEVVVHLLTDLAERDFKANNRIRVEGTPNLVDAAQAAKARRFVVASVAFKMPPEGAAALTRMEQLARDSGLEALIVPLDRLWGPGTWYETPESPTGFVHVDDAARRLRVAVLDGDPALRDHTAAST